MEILIVDVSLVITKNVFTKFFELCEWRNLVFLCLENCGNRKHCHCRTFFCLHFKIYAVKITFSEIFFYDQQRTLEGIFFIPLEISPIISDHATKPKLCYGKRKHFAITTPKGFIHSSSYTIRKISFSFKIMVGFRETILFALKCKSVKLKCGN